MLKPGPEVSKIFHILFYPKEFGFAGFKRIIFGFCSPILGFGPTNQQFFVDFMRFRRLNFEFEIKGQKFEP